MKESSRIRASHVNHGTALSRKELHNEKRCGRQFRHPKLLVSTESGNVTAYGGLALAARLSASLNLPSKLDAALKLLKGHRPFSESDHVLTHAYNLFLGGTCIEDIADLQCSEPLKRLLGAARIPDPTTAGDFLRRFDAPAVSALNEAIDSAQIGVWRRVLGRKRAKLGVVDIDSHVHHIYGMQKEGADFTYKGGYGYHPLVLSLSGTQEILRIINRPGNVPSMQGTEEAMAELTPLLRKRFKRVLWRGDSAFACQAVFDACDDADDYFAFVSRANQGFDKIADSLPQRAWRRFSAPEDNSKCRRKRGKNLRRLIARRRKKRDLKLEKQWLAEVPYQPARGEETYRLIVRRQQIEESRQGELFKMFRYRYVLTNLPRRYSTEAVIRLTYQRCDQENIIEQLQHGIAAMRMPTGSFLANAAFLTCARLAFNFKAWLAKLALSPEVLRWEWKRFRRSFVYIAARIVRSARQIKVCFAASHRFTETICSAVTKLQT